MSLPERSYLTPEQHATLVDELIDGNVEISIPRSMARQFYTMTPMAEIKSKTGQSELLAKLVVWFGLVVTPLLFTVCALLIIYYYGWWAACNIPLAGILWSVVAGFLNPTGSWVSMTVALVVFIVVAVTNLIDPSVILPVLLWTASLWVNRMTYHGAGFFLTRLVVTSQPAFELLEEHITVKEIVSDPQ